MGRIARITQRHPRKSHHLSEVTVLERRVEQADKQAAESADSWLEELEERCRINDAEHARVSLEHEAWQYRYNEYIHRRALGYRPHTPEEWGFESGYRHMISIMSATQDARERAPREQYVQPKLDKTPVGEIVIARNL